MDRQRWTTRSDLALAVFEYIEAFYIPTRRHSCLGDGSPVEFEARHTAASVAA